MDKTTWHPEVISPALAETVERFSRVALVADFYLAGGTALALYLGHRRSVDLDLFTASPFNEEVLIAALKHLPDLTVLSRSPQTLYLQLGGTKVSFIGYEYPLLFPLRDFNGIPVADLRDIGCMKISALASRGSRRDFVDLYLLAREYGLAHLLDLFQRKYAGVHYNSLHIKKALVYFDDAEKDPMPDMLTAVSWKEVKEFFWREVPSLP